MHRDAGQREQIVVLAGQRGLRARGSLITGLRHALPHDGVERPVRIREVDHRPAELIFGPAA